MKIIIISDIHANMPALAALPEDHYDLLWCLGDLVDYGPQPREAIRWVQSHASLCMRGNHDHAVAFDVDPQCSAPFIKLASSTRHFTQMTLSEVESAYLRSLPIQCQVTAGGAEFFLVHAIPTDPLFGYCMEHSNKWIEEVGWIHGDFLVVGHTHTPFVRKVNRTVIINPGSVGQPKTGRPLACYAVWEDGEVALKEYAYPISETADGIRKMPIARDQQDTLIRVLQQGGLPAAGSVVRTRHQEGASYA